MTMVPNSREKNWLFLSKGLFGLVIFILFGLVVVSPINAAEPELNIRDGEGYSAKYVSQSIPDPIEIEAGNTKTVVFKFKNVGTATWNSNSLKYISAYTVEPRYRSSEFKGASWLSSKQTAKIKGVVKPGEIGELELQLKAPSKTGDYVERFYLAAENYSWVKGGYFYVKIKVTNPANIGEDSANMGSEGVADSEDGGEYEAKRALLNKKSVEEAGGEQVKIIIAFQNKGDRVWSEYKFKAVEDGFADDSWEDNSVILSGEEEVAAGSFLRKTFYFRTPAKKGNYNFEFELNVDNGKLKQAVEIPVEVTKDAPAGYKAVKAKEVKPRLAAEPRIRVGIKAPEDYLQFRSYEDDYNVFDGSKKMGILKKKKFAVIKFADGRYSFDGGSLDFEADSYIRLEPRTNRHAVFYALNLDRKASWVSGANFNKYRGAAEYRKGEVDGQMYLVNDLLLEDYIKGMAETSSQAPDEFVKANLIAARNYAYVRKGSYPFFDVVGNTYDQLYLGYNAEKALPNVIAAAKDTRGLMATYDSEIVITPYFSNSSGWTRSWSSVWGGANKAWLVSVRCSYDAGRRRLGHGVGMSQRDAAYRAEEDGWDYEEILKYYYTGVEVERIYL